MATMASVVVDPADPLALHKLVFLNKVHTLKMYLAPYRNHHQELHADNHHSTDADSHHSTDADIHKETTTDPKLINHPTINALDNHLVTPLHLAVMLNRKDMVHILLKAGANPLTRSGSGWTPRQEATSLGNRELIEIITRHQRKAFTGSFKNKAMNLVKQLSEDLDQFYFQLQWEFQSWVPFVSGLCPNDTYHIWKKGNCVRMDTSLVGFENMKWLRGHISIIFRVDPETGPELVIIDRVKKITQRLAKSSDDEQQQAREPTEEELEEEVSICFNSDITSTNVPTSAIKFQRAKAGLWGYRTTKVEKVGEYECAVWKMDGVEFRTRVRTEHLKDEFGKPIAALKRHGPGGAAAGGGHQHASATGSKPLGEKEKRFIFKSSLDDSPSDSQQKRIGNGAAGGGDKNAQPRRPVHQPLFASFAEPEPMEEGDLQTENAPAAVSVIGEDGDTAKQLTFALSSSNGQGEQRPTVVPKKHARSTGTISDDAFFETALAQAEQQQEGDREDAEDEEEENPRVQYRESLPAPPAPSITFEEYFDQSKQGELHLGRSLEQKESRKTFGATLWMYDNNAVLSNSRTLHDNKSSASLAASSIASQDPKAGAGPPQFPLTIEKILPLLEVIGMDNNRLVGKLKEFLEFQLPPGFPIRANIPVYPSLSADVTFVNYDAQRIIGDEMFEVPGEGEGYMEGFVIRPGGEDDT